MCIQDTLIFLILQFEALGLTVLKRILAQKYLAWESDEDD